jgi:hypothetical protein
LAKNLSRPERLAEFFRRLGEAPAASSSDEAYRQICDILNAEEDENTSIPFDPAQWMTDGRMYPPQMDNQRPVPGRPDVRRFRSRSHHTLIGDNGAIEIRDSSGRPVFSKPGADGRAI